MAPAWRRFGKCLPLCFYLPLVYVFRCSFLAACFALRFIYKSRVLSLRLFRPFSLAVSLFGTLSLGFFFLFAVDLLVACQNSAANMNIYLFVFCRLFRKSLTNDFSQMTRDTFGYLPSSVFPTLGRPFLDLYNHHSRIAQCSEPITESVYQLRAVYFTDSANFPASHFPSRRLLRFPLLIMTGKTLSELNGAWAALGHCTVR